MVCNVGERSNQIIDIDNSEERPKKRHESGDSEEAEGERKRHKSGDSGCGDKDSKF